METETQDLSDRARRYLILGTILAIVAVSLLLLDIRLKRDIIAKVGEARSIVDEFGIAAKFGMEAPNGRQPAAAPIVDRASGDAGGEPGGGPGGVAPATGAGAVLDAADHHWEVAGDGGRAGSAGGPRGDG